MLLHFHVTIQYQKKHFKMHKLYVMSRVYIFHYSNKKKKHCRDTTDSLTQGVKEDVVHESETLTAWLTPTSQQRCCAEGTCCRGQQHRNDIVRSATAHFSQKEPQEVSKQDQVQSSGRLPGASSTEF